MSDVVDVGFRATSDGSEKQMAAAIAGAIEKAMKAASQQIRKDLESVFKGFAKGGGADFFNDMKSAADSLSDAMKRVADRADEVRGMFEAAARTSAEAFDPNLTKPIESGLQNIFKLQDEIARNAGNTDVLETRRLTQALEAARREIIQVSRTQAQATGLIRDAERNRNSEALRNSRERQAAMRSETAREVVSKQTAAAREVAIMRTSSAQQIAMTKSAAQQRVAAYELVGRAIRSIERGIRTVFEQTARVASTALRGLTNTASAVATGISNVFSRTGNRIRQTFTTTNQQITSDYSKSFSRNTQIVNQETNKQAGSIRQFAQNASQSLGGISLAGAGIVTALGGVAARVLTSGYQRATSIEDADRALTVMLGSAEKAKQLSDQVMDIVTGTPFAFDQFAQGATQMAAFSVEADKIPRYLEAIGDAAAVRGKQAAQTIDSLILTYGQVSTAGRLMGQDLLQLTSAGVPALQILGNAYGMTTEDMREMMSDGAIPAAEALDILTEGILNGTDGINGTTAAMKGLGKELGNTLSGSVANFGITFARMGANLIEVFNDILVSVFQAASEIVDGIGRITLAIGKAIRESPAIELLARSFDGLGARIKRVSLAVQPYIESFARAFVQVGTGLVAIATLRRLPGVLGTVGVAMWRLITPARLLIVGMIAFKTAFDNARENSPELADALSKLSSVFSNLAKQVIPPLLSALAAIGEALANFVAPAARILEKVIISTAVPALEWLADFIEKRVVPALTKFAGFIRDTIAPAVGDFLGSAVDKLRSLFGSLVDFIRNSVIPWVGPKLEAAVEIGRKAFAVAYNFLSTKFLPFVQNNLIPVLGGLAAAVGSLALGGGFGFAGLLAGGGLIAAALTDDGIRSKIFGFWDSVVSGIQERFRNLFSEQNMRAVGIGALNLARRVGRLISETLLDRRVVTVTAAAAAAAAAFAGAFLLGLGEGIMKSIPDLVGLLGDALWAAFKEVTSDPRLIAAVVGIFAGAKLLRSIQKAGRQAAAVFAQGMMSGSSGLGGVLGGGNNLRGFMDGLFGRQGALAGRIQGEMTQARQILTREMQNMNRIATRITGRGLGNALDPAQAGRIQSGYQQLIQTYGRATVAGAQFRTGFDQIIQGFRRGEPLLRNMGQGFRNIGSSLRLAAGELGVGLGGVVAATFMASFVSNALLATESSGMERLQSGLGLALSGLMAYQATGGGTVGAVAAGGVVGFGLLTSAINRSQEATKKLNADIKTLGRSLAGLDAPEVEDRISAQVMERFLDQSEKVQKTLKAIGLEWDTFAAAAQSGGGLDHIASVFEALGPKGREFAEALRNGDITLGRIDDTLKNVSIASPFDGIQSEIEAAGHNVNDFANAMGFAGESLKFVEGSIRNMEALNSTLDTSSARSEALVATHRELADGMRVNDEAAEVFRSTLERLNNERLDALRGQVRDAEDALYDVRAAANEAQQAFIDFITGGGRDLTLEDQTNRAVLNVESVGKTLEGLKDSAGRAAGFVEAEMEQALGRVRDDAANMLRDTEVTNKTEARAALQPLLDAAGDVAGEAGDRILEELEGMIDNFNTGKGLALQLEFTAAREAVAEAQRELDAANESLEIGLTVVLDRESFDIALAAARELDAGFQATFDDSDAPDAVKGMVERAAAASRDPAARQTMANNGDWLAGGVVTGIDKAVSRVTAAARNLANQAAATVASTLQMRSPSKVTERQGVFFSEGLAIGIASGVGTVTSSVAALTTSAMASLAPAVRKGSTAVVNTLSAVGRSAADAIGKGFAEQGPSFIRSVGGALDAALNEAMSKANQFKAIGRELASGLFGQMGISGLGTIGGGGARADLQRAFINMAGIGGRIQESLQKQVDEFGFYGLTFDLQFAAGRSNQDAFYQAGQEIRNYGQALLDAGRSTESAVWEMQHYRDNVISVARSFGATTAQVNEMLNMLGLTDTQLNKFIKDVKATEKAVRDATAAEEARMAAEKAAEAAEEASKRKAEADKAAADAAAAVAAEAARTGSTAQAVFRDLVIQTPSGDPEAVALATANKVAMRVRR